MMSATSNSELHTAGGKSRHVRSLFMWLAYLIASTAVMTAAVMQISQEVWIHSTQQTPASTISGAMRFPYGTAPTVAAQTAFVFDADTGLTLYAKNANVELPQASCTKIMTALVAVERGNLNQVITVGADAHALVNPDSSYMGLSVGEKLTLRELLYGLLLPSGNDAAVAIADGIAGNVPNFVALMNQRAQQLGLTRTHFANPHGLNAPNHYTSARDLAVLAAVAMRNPILMKITSTLTYYIPATATHKAFNLVTGDDLLGGASSPYPGAIGVKPGYTGPAMFCEAFAAIRHGHLVVGAVLHEPSWQIRIVDMRALLDWGFEQEGLPPAPSPVPRSYPTDA